MNTLHFSVLAQADLTEIKEYITEDLENPIAATSTIRKIMGQIRILSGQAFIGTPLSAVTDIESDYRFLVSGSYLIFYRAYGTEVFIDRVLYGRRDYLRILFEELPESNGDE